MAKRSSISPTLTVFGIWWVTTTYLSPTHDWDSSGRMAIIVLFGVFLGMVAAVTSVAVLRKGYRTIVAPTELRGLRCSIGEVPLPMPEPPRAEELPSVSPVTMPDIPADFVDNWLDEYASEYPHHAALFKALLLVLNHRPDLPATHVYGGHGGRTLLQHSMLTAWIMTEVSKGWTYDGLRDRTGKKIVVPLRDDKYRFVPHDPMVAIIGLAHDIGKIESFIYNDSGEVVGIRSEHDLTGSRMVARMQEAWDIPAEDRDAMLLAIAHYHHPVELPMAPSQRNAIARDDRTIALMELLIRADFTVTRVENGEEMPTEDDYRSLESVRSVSPEQLFDEFVALIHEAHRINSGNIKYSVGQISPAPDNKGALLYLHEESLRTHIMRRLGLQSSEHLGNGRYQITVDLLNVLKARGLLYTTFENLDYSAGNAMWVCEVLGSKGQKVSNWPCVIATKIDQFEKLQNLGFFSSSIKILRNRFGAHMGRQIKNAPGDTMVLGGLGSSNDIPEAPSPRKTRNKDSKTSRHQPGDDKKNRVLRSDPGQPVASPLPESPAPVIEAVASNEEREGSPAISAPVEDPPVTSMTEQENVPDPQGNEDSQQGVVSSKDSPDIAPEVTRGSEPLTVMESASSATDQLPPSFESTPVAIEHPAGTELSSQNVKELIEALMYVVDLGKNGKLKCHKGNLGNIVFNLDALFETPFRKMFSSREVIEYLASGKVKGVNVTRIKSATLVSVTPPISFEA